MRALIAVLVTAGLVYAQANRDLLLPQNRPVSGTVSDPAGNPIADARIDHLGRAGWTVVKTDAFGKFEAATRAPAFVIRKASYRSQWVQIASSSEVKITLQPTGSVANVRACSRAERCDSIEGWGAQFCFPRVSGVKVGRQGKDIDYGVRGYGTGSGGIMHGSGPNWSFGLPYDPDVWQSVEYQERVFGADPLITIDARGRTAGFGEVSASWANQLPTATSMKPKLDCLTACWTAFASVNPGERSASCGALLGF